MLKLTHLSGFGAGGSAGPSIISVSNITVITGNTMSFVVTTDQPVTLTIGGADAAQVELVSNTLATSHTLRWSSDGTRSVGSPADADSDNVYEITLTPTNASSVDGIPQNLQITVDYDWVDSLGFDFSGTTADYNGYTVRETFDSLIIDHSNSHVRLRLQSGILGSVHIDALYIGEKAASGDVYDMKASAPAPAQLLVGGSGSFVIPTDSMIDTDILNFAIDETKSYVVSAHFNGEAKMAVRTGFPSGVDIYFKSGVNEAATANASGYSGVSPGTVYLVKKIQTTTP